MSQKKASRKKQCNSKARRKKKRKQCKREQEKNATNKGTKRQTTEEKHTQRGKTREETREERTWDRKQRILNAELTFGKSIVGVLKAPVFYLMATFTTRSRPLGRGHETWSRGENSFLQGVNIWHNQGIRPSLRGNWKWKTVRLVQGGTHKVGEYWSCISRDMRANHRHHRPTRRMIATAKTHSYKEQNS